ncbi:hypothetical protein BaRGS_00016706 [Batillaria attramentaria]|uniref:Uncharacterized protein n=1 Tax=Batillaria attramentaria TaxID=370345 RepID=A0ABD0KZ53_9CAEN
MKFVSTVKGHQNRCFFGNLIPVTTRRQLENHLIPSQLHTYPHFLRSIPANHEGSFSGRGQLRLVSFTGRKRRGKTLIPSIGLLSQEIGIPSFTTPCTSAKPSSCQIGAMHTARTEARNAVFYLMNYAAKSES